MGSRDFLYKAFLSGLGFAPTSCQERFFRSTATFLTDDEGDILVVSGYAGTGKTTAVAAVISALSSLGLRSVLLSPTGRSAKVLSSYAGRPACTIHKHIYRQKAIGEDGFGKFTISHNKAKDTLFVVDEASLIGVEQGHSNLTFGSGNLLADLINFVRSASGCKLMLVGDPAQLPPVGLDQSPALSRDYMSLAGGVRYVSLTTVVRQARESGILHNATILRNHILSGTDSLAFQELKLSVEGFPDVVRIGGAELLDTLSQAYDDYGEENVTVLCRSNKRCGRYNAGIRAQIHYKEEILVRGEKLMIVKNCYQFQGGGEDLDYIANGDIARLLRVSHFEERYGLHFADARLLFPDYDNVEIRAKLCLDTLENDASALSVEQQNSLYRGVFEDYAHLITRKKRNEAVREDPFYNALQVKYAEAITCHKSQGGQWACVFIDNPFWRGELSVDDLKWLYTAITRGIEKVYLVNFRDEFFL